MLRKKKVQHLSLKIVTGMSLRKVKNLTELEKKNEKKRLKHKIKKSKIWDSGAFTCVRLSRTNFENFYTWYIPLSVPHMLLHTYTRKYIHTSMLTLHFTKINENSEMKFNHFTGSRDSETVFSPLTYLRAVVGLNK